MDGSRFALAVDAYGCHHAHADHDGTRASELRAMADAANTAYRAHEHATRPDYAPSPSAT
jgi:hypothetical protein